MVPRISIVSAEERKALRKSAGTAAGAVSSGLGIVSGLHVQQPRRLSVLLDVLAVVVTRVVAIVPPAGWTTCA
jgi:hypothetical protein